VIERNQWGWHARFWPVVVVGTDADRVPPPPELWRPWWHEGTGSPSFYLHALGSLVSVVWMGSAKHLSWRLFVVKYIRGVGLELVWPWER
jgi:hypothetical protein